MPAPPYSPPCSEAPPCSSQADYCYLPSKAWIRDVDGDGVRRGSACRYDESTKLPDQNKHHSLTHNYSPVKTVQTDITLFTLFGTDHPSPSPNATASLFVGFTSFPYSPVTSRTGSPKTTQSDLIPSPPSVDTTVRNRSSGPISTSTIIGPSFIRICVRFILSCPSTKTQILARPSSRGQRPRRPQSELVAHLGYISRMAWKVKGDSDVWTHVQQPAIVGHVLCARVPSHRPSAYPRPRLGCSGLHKSPPVTKASQKSHRTLRGNPPNLMPSRIEDNRASRSRQE